MLAQPPDIIDTFEKTYFDISREDRDEWQEKRIKWYVLSSMLEAVKWMSINRAMRMGSEIKDENEPYPAIWAQEKFTIAAAALAADINESEPGKIIRFMREWINAQRPAREQVNNG